MKEKTFIIKNPVWMHPGTAVSFTFRMEKFSSTITVSRGGDTRNGKEFYELMKLRNVKGEKTTFKAEGPDENETINSVIEFMDEHAELS